MNTKQQTPPAPKKRLFALTPETAIRKRLMIYLGCGLAAAWLAANAVSLTLALHELNESADSQMSELAHALPYVSAEKTIQLPKIKKSLGKDGRGFARDKNHGIAVWDSSGKLLLADRKGREIPFSRQAGFKDKGRIWQENSWRIVYVRNAETGQTAAVAQRWHDRLDMLWHIVSTHLLASLLILPLMALLLHLAVRRSIRPLDILAQDLASRQADNLAPVSRAVPQETQPLIDALNHLLERVRRAVSREQRFTADAAHELRSPLAALKVQADVLALADADEQAHHLHQMRQSIDRAEHLVNQLLTLARLDPEQGLKEREHIDWDALSRQVLQHVNLSAREKHIRLVREGAEKQALPLEGNAVLIQLLLRNLLDNAIRYSPENSEVGLYFQADSIEIRDHGSGIAPEHLPHIKERFYRPAGQNAQGSGLGLSIAEQIAKMHGLRLDLENRPQGGLSVWIRREA